MWREIRLLADSKPVIASMSDVAASGGYYMAMAAPVIVAEKLTLTGSIGVVTGDPYYLLFVLAKTSNKSSTVRILCSLATISTLSLHLFYSISVWIVNLAVVECLFLILLFLYCNNRKIYPSKAV